MAFHLGKILAPDKTQPTPGRAQGDAGTEHVAPSRTRDCEFEPRLSQVPAGRLLFLDDDPQRAIVFLSRHPDATWVLTAKECIARLAEGWDQVHLDHDLGGEVFVDPLREDCGMEVVRWLCTSEQKQLRETWFIIHSHNCEAASDMVRHLRESGYHAEYRPFGVELLDRLQEPQPKSPAAATACRLPGSSQDCQHPGAIVTPPPETWPALHLGAFFERLRRIVTQRWSPDRGMPFGRQGDKGEPGQRASREADSQS